MFLDRRHIVWICLYAFLYFLKLPFNFQKLPIGGLHTCTLHMFETGKWFEELPMWLAAWLDFFSENVNSCKRTLLKNEDDCRQQEDETQESLECIDWKKIWQIGIGMLKMGMRHAARMRGKRVLRWDWRSEYDLQKHQSGNYKYEWSDSLIPGKCSNKNEWGKSEHSKCSFYDVKCLVM